MQKTRIGPFALEEPFNQPTGGNLFRALHVERQLWMAIKLLPREVVDRPMGGSHFNEDVKRLQTLVHENIVRVYGGAVEAGQPYLAMELVEGESLRTLLDRRGKLPWETAVELAIAICQALEYAHGKGVVHQRINPNRVLLSAQGGTKLTGFDCHWADHDQVLGLRSPMRIAHYLAPEAFRGKQSALLPQCDLFSLGVLLYEMLSGEVPWTAGTPSELIQARREGFAPRVSSKTLDCPVWLDALVMRLLALQRSDRPQSADETRRAILLAEQKASAGVGATQDALAGKQRGLGADDRAELDRLKRRRSRPHRPVAFYESAWFLSLSLLCLLGLAGWLLLPPSEEVLYAAAVPLMDSSDVTDWKRAETQYLLPLLERFPETQHRAEIESFQKRYAIHRAQQRIENLDRFGRMPKHDAERACAEAWECEQFGDSLAAWKKYEALVHLFGDSTDPDVVQFVLLARHRAQQIESDPAGRGGSTALIRQRLAEAQTLADQGELLDSRRLLKSILSIYQGSEELRPVLDQARQQLAELDQQSTR